MGAQLGDYIHLHYNNYRRYGLAKQTRGRGTGSAQKLELTSLLSAAKAEAFSTLKSASVSKNLQNIQNLANQLMGGENKGSTNSSLTSNDIQELREAIVQYLNKGFGTLTADDIDWETLQIKPSSYSKVKGMKFQENYARKLTTLRGNTRFKNSEAFKPSTFQSYVNDLQRAYTEVVDSLSKKDSTRIKKELEDLKTIAENYQGQKLISSKENEQGALNRKRLFDLAKDLIKLQSINVLEGTLLEAVVAATGSQIADIGGKAIDQLLGEFVTGSRTDQLSYSSTNFSKGIDTQKIFASQIGDKSMSTRQSGDAISYDVKLKTQGKVDVEFFINDEAYRFSAKNYNLANQKYDNISLVTGTRLLTTLQQEGQFLNHYLNQAVVSQDQSHLDVGPNDLIRRRANQALREMMIFKSVVGGNLYRIGGVVGAKANIFVVNDKGQKCGIRFITVEGLLSKVITQVKDLEKNFNITPDIPTWSNLWQKTKEARITNVIAQTNKYKYSVYVKKNAIKTALY